MLDKSKSPTRNMMKKELRYVRALKQNEYFRMLLMWHVYKIISASPASKLLPSGTLRLGMKFINIIFDPMKVPNFFTVGVSGVWIFSACVMVLYVVSMV
jgi:hypothetical protein